MFADAKRKPGEFRVAGYDPETGQHIKNETAPLQKAMQEVEALRLRGILSEEEARMKIGIIRAQMEAAETANDRSNQSLRNRMFGGGKPPRQASTETKGFGLVPSPPSSQRDAASEFGGSVISSGSSAVFSSSGNDIIAGMLVRDGKLQRFSLSNTGVLTQAPLSGGGGVKQWQLSNQNAVASSTTKANHFNVTFGKTTLKLAANSEDELAAWIGAISRIS